MFKFNMKNWCVGQIALWFHFDAETNWSKKNVFHIDSQNERMHDQLPTFFFLPTWTFLRFQFWDNKILKNVPLFAPNMLISPLMSPPFCPPSLPSARGGGLKSNLSSPMERIMFTQSLMLLASIARAPWRTAASLALAKSSTLTLNCSPWSQRYLFPNKRTRAWAVRAVSIKSRATVKVSGSQTSYTQMTHWADANQPLTRCENNPRSWEGRRLVWADDAPKGWTAVHWAVPTSPAILW